jgi:DNA-binding CsgD family transcriptional regulator
VTLFGHGIDSQGSNLPPSRMTHHHSGSREGDGGLQQASSSRARACSADVHCIRTHFFLDGDHYGFCVHRSRDGVPFVAAEERRLQELMPHLKRALLTRSRLRAQLRRIEQLENLLGQQSPLFLVTDRLEVRWMVQGAFPPLDSVYLAERGSVVLLCARSPDLHARLLRAVTRATQGTGPLSDVIEAADWTAFVDHYPSSETDRLATIRFIDKREHIRRVTNLAQLRHDLTRSEVALCASLLHGESLQQHAASHGIRISTARSHLKTLLAKTGTSRQGEVVALLSRYSAAAH